MFQCFFLSLEENCTMNRNERGGKMQLEPVFFGQEAKLLKAEQRCQDQTATKSQTVGVKLEIFNGKCLMENN